MKEAKAAKIKDWYRGAESVGRLIAECRTFEELDQALNREYNLKHHPGAQGETEAQKAIREIQNKLYNWIEQGKGE